MREFVYNNLEHVLCLLILVGRLGDILSTYMVTPTLRLEANFIAKKLGWPFCWLTLLVCLVPYYDTALGILVLVPSLMVSASNTGKIWLVRAIGEDKYIEIVQMAVKQSKLSHILLCTLFSSFFISLMGFTLLYLSDPQYDWGFWFGMGIMFYGMIILIHGSLYSWRLFRKVKAEAVNTQATLPEQEF